MRECDCVSFGIETDFVRAGNVAGANRHGFRRAFAITFAHQAGERERSSRRRVFFEFVMRFDQEWVLIDDYVSNEYQQVLSGRVRYHSKDKDEVDRKMFQMKLKRFAMLYIGEMILPEGTEIIL